MSRVCDICGKRSIVGYKISHSHRKTKRKWFPNLQKVRAVVNGSRRKVTVCAKCLKAGKITK